MLIATGEERAEAIGTRARRLRCRHTGDIRLVATRSPDRLRESILKTQARFVIVDSLNSLRADGEMRRHSQYAVRDIALDLVDFSHAENAYEGAHDPVTMVLVCHVNKSMDVSGVKEIEHMVDVAGWFRGQRNQRLRKFELEKNRFGATDNRALFSMGPTGLIELSEEQAAIEERRERHAQQPIEIDDED